MSHFLLFGTTSGYFILMSGYGISESTGLDANNPNVFSGNPPTPPGMLNTIVMIYIVPTALQTDKTPVASPSKQNWQTVISSRN